MRTRYSEGWAKPPKSVGIEIVVNPLDAINARPKRAAMKAIRWLQDEGQITAEQAKVFRRRVRER